MIRRSLLVATFPIMLLCLLAAERITTILLAYFPDSADLWQAWSILHSSFGEFWRFVEQATANSFGLQLALIVSVIVLLLLGSRARKWVALAFLANHASLILAGASMLAAAKPAISTLDFDTLPAATLSMSYSLSTLQISVVIVGAASCMLCHVAFWLNARHRTTPIELRIRLLQAGL